MATSNWRCNPGPTVSPPRASLQSGSEASGNATDFANLSLYADYAGKVELLLHSSPDPETMTL
ncbi:MAG: hypothetical protein U5O39_11845 [Gammaproteobacteria bacterium]|nr:hypothetical protein [Gammaproteobacteria bacterium]